MDAGGFVLFVFVAICVLLGMCLASLRGFRRELDSLKSVVTMLGNVQRDATQAQETKADDLDLNALLAAVAASKSDD